MNHRISDYNAMAKAIEELCKRLNHLRLSGSCLFNLRLVATELVSNVLKHEKSHAYLSVSVKDEFLHVLVESESRFFSHRDHGYDGNLYNEYGRGLHLVRTLCENRVYDTERGVVALLRAEF